jgi:hypothetical protein
VRGRETRAQRSLRVELLVSAAMMAAPAVASAQVFATFQASGANPAAIQSTVDAYRTRRDSDR